jgi:arsenite methyltransferase
MKWPSIRVPDKKSYTVFKTLFLLLVLIGGCAKLKQWAYEGLNRDAWQQPERVIQFLRVRAGDHVADLGSGSGYFTFRLAKAVGPGGKVYAVDIDAEMNELVAQRARQESADNVEVILAEPNDSKLPSTGVDLIFTANTFHHFQDRVAYFVNLRKHLRPNGRVAVIDFDRRAWFQGLWSHYTPAEFIRREMEQAGYILQRDLNILDRQSFQIFGVARPG